MPIVLIYHILQEKRAKDTIWLRTSHHSGSGSNLGTPQFNLLSARTVERKSPGCSNFAWPRRSPSHSHGSKLQAAEIWRTTCFCFFKMINHDKSKNISSVTFTSYPTFTSHQQPMKTPSIYPTILTICSRSNILTPQLSGSGSFGNARWGWSAFVHTPGRPGCFGSAQRVEETAHGAGVGGLFSWIGWRWLLFFPLVNSTILGNWLGRLDISWPPNQQILLPTCSN